jgi:hypothetical protein
VDEGTASVQAQERTSIPQFEFDPTFPKLPLPNQWTFGELGGVSVDPQGNIWVAHRPWTVWGRELAAVSGAAECCRPAPSIIQFDPQGSVLRSWPELRRFDAAPGTSVGQSQPEVGPRGAELWEAAPGPYGDWGRREHTVIMDHQENVWVTIDESHVIYKFTRDGRHQLTIGVKDQRGDSNDPQKLGRPTGLAVDPAANELFVSDGYDNRRVIVFDAATGRYKRHWGAYGARPDDAPMPRYDPTAPPSKQFSTVHGIWLAPDGLVYVADRANNRIQVFDKGGKFLREAFVAPQTTDIGSAYGVAVSPDNRWVYVNAVDTIWILDRETLKVAGRFGSQGRHGGQFLSAHSMTVDRDGNILVAESRGRRVQRFNLMR